MTLIGTELSVSRIKFQLVYPQFAKLLPYLLKKIPFLPKRRLNQGRVKFRNVLLMITEQHKTGNIEKGDTEPETNSTVTSQVNFHGVYKFVSFTCMDYLAYFLYFFM